MKRNQLERGQGLVAYAMVLALIGIASIGALQLFGGATEQVYEDIGCALEEEGVAEVTGDCVVVSAPPEPENPDPCPDIDIQVTEFRCNGNQLRLRMQVNGCYEDYGSTNQNSGISVQGTNLNVRHRGDIAMTDHRRNTSSSSEAAPICNPSGALYSQDTFTFVADHDGPSGDGTHTTTFTVPITR
ncbi:MAG: hypothetical protein AAF125_05600 [Chloroflexota bacterium]